MAQQQQPPVFDDIRRSSNKHHPIFREIRRGKIEAVQQRVLADPAVLEERGQYRRTPLMEAIFCDKPALALWLLKYRGHHSVETAADAGVTALHYASHHGPLEVVHALMCAGADPVAVAGRGYTPLVRASSHGRIDTVAYLLQLPIVKASIDHSTQYLGTALSLASRDGHQPTVQLLLDAGADPTIPAGHRSPLNRALSNNCHAIAAPLRHVIADAERAHALHKARSLLGAGAAALACLQGRMEQGQAPPTVEHSPPQQQHQQQQQQHEKLRETAAFAVGMSGGKKDGGLCEELYVELQEYMLPAWADKGPEA